MFFSKKITEIDASSTFITPEHAFFLKKFEQIAYSNHSAKKIGRLYDPTSIQTLPRELRYYLFKDEYIDFDMINSHPSILYQFALDNNLILSGFLKEFIFNRELIVQNIEQEYLKIYKKKINPADVKQLILSQMNKT